MEKALVLAQRQLSTLTFNHHFSRSLLGESTATSSRLSCFLIPKTPRSTALLVIHYDANAYVESSREFDPLMYGLLSPASSFDQKVFWSRTRNIYEHVWGSLGTTSRSRFQVGHEFAPCIPRSGYPGSAIVAAIPTRLWLLLFCSTQDSTSKAIY